MPYDENNPLYTLSEEQLESLGKELDALHDEVFAELGDVDAGYIRNMIKLQRRLVAASRGLLLFSRFKPAWVAGTAALSVAKILENMEIGHNVMHGQWDWMNDPNIHSSTWDWDTASPAAAWKHSHNYVHHTYTNVIGKDKDVGYEIFRVDPRQPWKPGYLFQPIGNVILMALFEWGVALHDLDFEQIKSGQKSRKQVWQELKAIGVKARRQILKDYIAYPGISAGANAAVALSSGGDAEAAARGAFKATLVADAVANVVRNVWSNVIIFCGHFPDQTFMFTEEEVANETRGGWYVRQMIGAANIDGGPLFHIMSGNLSYQVEHHLFPDMPSSRYQQIAPRVREICERYGLPYNTGPLRKQWGTVQRTILRLAFPGGGPRPKPGPYEMSAQEKADKQALEDRVPAFP
ncbi:linoleoyl-CoA desaturase [Jatrophihabitans endophyticus]|uniref:Linoleoyl-CoA desaturase n=1 Tax=Jatrophihabitans endophyticus TaxID=1206085 RepID=A0A1M5KGU5_9ACTN|nr:acyl-CoA desaturase [Jatrophihabitans endophyticus]SHG51967.1 linoleoyl-CoA desaturase [Jatrophihabitans endophyticus]